MATFKQKNKAKDKEAYQLKLSDLPYPGFPLAEENDYIETQDNGVEVWIKQVPFESEFEAA